MNQPEARPSLHRASVGMHLSPDLKADIAHELSASLDELSIFTAPSLRRTKIDNIPMTERHPQIRRRILGRAILSATFAALKSGRTDTELFAKGQGIIPDRRYHLTSSPERAVHDWHITEGTHRTVARNHVEVLDHLRRRLDTQVSGDFLDQPELTDTQTRDILQQWLTSTPAISLEDTLAFSGSSYHMPSDDADSAYETGAVLTTTQLGFYGASIHTARIGAPIIIPRNSAPSDGYEVRSDTESLAQQSYLFRVDRATPTAEPHVKAVFQLSSDTIPSGRLNELAVAKQYPDTTLLSVLGRATTIVKDNKTNA